MISSISLFEIIDAIMPDPKNFFWIAASVADAATVNFNGTKILLVYGVSTFFINDKSGLINGFSNLRNPPSGLVMCLVVPELYWIKLIFSKDLITFI